MGGISEAEMDSFVLSEGHNLACSSCVRIILVDT